MNKVRACPGRHEGTNDVLWAACDPKIDLGISREIS